MTKATKKPRELKDAEFDKVQGAGTKGLIGDEIGVPGGGTSSRR